MLMRWDDMDPSFDRIDDLRRRMDALFQEFGAGLGQAGGAATAWPRMNLRDGGAALTLTADVPGLSEKDVKLTVNQDVLTLEGERRVEAPKGYAVHRQERVPIRFARSFRLPCKVNPEKAQAAVKDGVLLVTLPKAPEAQPRQIEVKTQ